jgi:hypothetical protein
MRWLPDRPAGGVYRHAMASTLEPYERTHTKIRALLSSLEAGAPASSGEGAWTRQELEAELHTLREDEKTLLAHSERRVQMVAEHDPEICAACGHPRHCETARALFARYAD